MDDLTTAPESLFWYWINERHSIYLRRQRGEPKPWTADPILQKYKFTNAFRELDTGTVWLRENFLEPHKDDDAGLLIFNIAWYRCFNWWKTAEYLGWKTNWDKGCVADNLLQRAEQGDQVFTNAHIVWGEPGKSKIDAICEQLTPIWEHRKTLVDACAANNLEHLFDTFKEFYGFGGFTSYEIVSDVRHTRLLDHATDIMTWANPGPGAIRGLRRLSLPWKPRAAAIYSMFDLLQRSNERAAVDESLRIPGRLGQHVPALEMRDIEHSLCEFDKYVRVQSGEGTPRMTYAGV